jgi:hypothetical protein
LTARRPLSRLQESYEGFYRWAAEPAMRGKGFNFRWLLLSVVFALTLSWTPLVFGAFWQIALALLTIGGCHAWLSRRL